MKSENIGKRLGESSYIEENEKTRLDRRNSKDRKMKLEGEKN